MTAVEVGNIKRDIAYHGDVLNTAARIQALCNEYDQHLLISTELLGKIHLGRTLRVEKLGHVLLKGKEHFIEMAGIKE